MQFLKVVVEKMSLESADALGVNLVPAVPQARGRAFLSCSSSFLLDFIKGIPS